MIFILILKYSMLLSNFFPIFFLTFKNFMTNGSPMNECGLWNNFFFLIRLLFSLNHFWDKHNPSQLNKVKIQSVAWPKLKEVEGCLIFHIIFLNQPGFWGNSWFYINIKIYEFFLAENPYALPLLKMIASWKCCLWDTI